MDEDFRIEGNINADYFGKAHNEATNTIENMKSIAKAVLDNVEKKHE